MDVVHFSILAKFTLSAGVLYCPLYYSFPVHSVFHRKRLLGALLP